MTIIVGQDTAKTRKTITSGDQSIAYYSIPAAQAAGLGDFSKLPAALKVVLENMLRFEDGKTVEAKLARDADHLALVLELKELIDIGYEPPKTWIQIVIDRLQTKTGQQIASAVMQTARDEWWLDITPNAPEI